MRYLTIIIITLILLIAPIEARAEEISDVPNQDMIYLFTSPLGIIPVPISKGALNAGMEGIHWFTPTHWQKHYDALQKWLKEEEKSRKELMKKYPGLFGLEYGV